MRLYLVGLILFMCIGCTGKNTVETSTTTGFTPSSNTVSPIGVELKYKREW
jgi:hypothetical protein